MCGAKCDSRVVARLVTTTRVGNTVAIKYSLEYTNLAHRVGLTCDVCVYINTVFICTGIHFHESVPTTVSQVRASSDFSVQSCAILCVIVVASSPFAHNFESAATPPDLITHTNFVAVLLLCII